MYNDIYRIIADLRANGEKAFLCTVVSAKGSTPCKEGAKMIVWKDGHIYGTIGGGKLEKTVMETVSENFTTPLPKLLNYNLLNDLGMACGGQTEIYIEPLFNQSKLYIFGAGHVAKALVDALRRINFDITVIDFRDKIFEDWDKTGICIYNHQYLKFIEEHSVDENTFIVITTHSHVTDAEVLKYCLKMPYAYLGLIGSKRKVQELRKSFITDGLATDAELDRINMPVGLDINAEGPYEIAISIAAKLIQEKNNK